VVDQVRLVLRDYPLQEVSREEVDAHVCRAVGQAAVSLPALGGLVRDLGVLDDLGPI
jgi:hypothetical protein